MIDKNKNELTKKNIDMTMDVMCNNLIYWSQDLFHNNLFNQGSHILSMTSSGGRRVSIQTTETSEKDVVRRNNASVVV